MSAWDFALNYKVLVHGSHEVYVPTHRGAVLICDYREISDREFEARAKSFALEPFTPSFSLPKELITKRVHYMSRRLPLSDEDTPPRRKLMVQPGQPEPSEK